MAGPRSGLVTTSPVGPAGPVIRLVDELDNECDEQALASRQAAALRGLSPRLMDELAELAADKVRDGGLLVELPRHLMQGAVEAEMDLHLAEEVGRIDGRGSRSGGNVCNSYRPRKVMTGGRCRPRGTTGHLPLEPAAEVSAQDRRPGGDGPLAHREGVHVRGDRRVSRRDLAGPGTPMPATAMLTAECDTG